METSDRFNELCSVEASTSLREFRLLTKMEEQLTAVKEIHNEVELSIGLEGVVQLNDEGTVDLFQNVTFGLRLN